MSNISTTNNHITKNSSSSNDSQFITPSKSSSSSQSSSTTNTTIDPIVQKKLEKLQEAFIKSLEVSVASVNEFDCQECFGDQRKPLGVQLQRTYINLLAEVERKLEEQELPRINQEFQIPSILQMMHYPQQHLPPHPPSSNDPITTSSTSTNPSAALTATLPVTTTTTTIEDPKKQLRPVIKAMKRMEIEELTNGIKLLETEIRKSKDIAGRLRTQMLNEIEALNEEKMKILHASNQAI